MEVPPSKSLGLNHYKDGDVEVGIFPEGEEVLISGSGFLLVACQQVGATELEMRKGGDWPI